MFSNPIVMFVTVGFFITPKFAVNKRKWGRDFVVSL